jgi:cytochrome c5
MQRVWSTSATQGRNRVRTIIAGVATVGTLLLLQGPLANARFNRSAETPAPSALPLAAPASHDALAGAAAITPEDLTKVVQKTCVVCHNDQLMTGNVSFQHFQVEKANENFVVAEKMIRKLRAGMMPPPGMPSSEGRHARRARHDARERRGRGGGEGAHRGVIVPSSA